MHVTGTLVPERSVPGAWSVLARVALAELLGMSLWFGAAAVAPQMAAELGFTSAAAGRLTEVVQIGFVLGTLTSAILTLSDRIPPRVLVAVSALLGALANGAIAVVPMGSDGVLALRFATGFALAGVYPPGMKMLAAWFVRGRGTALGILVGALTLGKASPYLLNAIGSESWRVNMLTISGMAVVAAALAATVRPGPYGVGAAPFDIRKAVLIFRDRPVRLASFGYFGHMWELYAMWTWVPVMIRASFELRGADPRLAEAASFAVIGAGALGCMAGGIAADRIGRTAVTSIALAISGACCLAVGFLYGGPPFLLILLAVVWGASVVADSAQFSASTTELADPRYVGSALTMQIAIGFLLTIVSIRLIPGILDRVGWEWAFVALAPGPVFGIWSMLKLRRLPEAAKIAHGMR
jgi:MFS family permease